MDAFPRSQGLRQTPPISADIADILQFGRGQNRDAQDPVAAMNLEAAITFQPPQSLADRGHAGAHDGCGAAQANLFAGAEIAAD